MPSHHAYRNLTLIVTAALVSAYTYVQTIGIQCQHYCAEMFQSIIDGSAASPYRYRPLSAWIAAPFTGAGIPIAYSVTHAIALPVMFVALYAWLRQWTDETTALTGVLMAIAFMPLMIQVWGIALYAPIEVILLCTGLLLLHTARRAWEVPFTAITFLASLNRETAVLLPLAFLALHIERWRRRWYWRRAALFLGIWGAVFISLRLWLGSAPDTLTIAETWALNMGGGWYTIVAVVKNALFLPVWILVAANARRAPVPLQRLALVGFPYLALCLIFGLWHEVRLWLPLLVLWLPLLLYEREKGALTGG